MTSTTFKEKRAHRRLDIHLPLEYRRQAKARSNVYRTMTVNVSTGGLYFITADESLLPGDVLALEMEVPPGDGPFPQESRISTTGEVIRTTVIDSETKPNGVKFSRYGVAAKFQKDFKLTF